MINQFKAVTISYKNAPLNVRAKIALTEDECKDLMIKINEVFQVVEVMILSTCNRTEIYYCAEETFGEALIKLLSAQKTIPSAQILPYFEIIDQQTLALKHLFEVSVGLQSQVIGDLQISGQVKQAYQWAAEVQLAGPFLHRLMHVIFFANKRIAQETVFRSGVASTSYATCQIMESFLPSLANPRILVLGLGKIGEDVCRTLKDSHYRHITVMNRTRAKAEILAHELGFIVADFEDFETQINEADIVISSVRLDNPLITKRLFSGIQTVKYLFDLSVPRSVEADIEQIAGVLLFDLDQIQLRAKEGIDARLAAVPEVLEIMAEAMRDFNDWSQELVVSPTIGKLKNVLEQMRKEEMAKFMKTFTEQEKQKMEKITASLMQKVLKLPVLQLKAACKRGEAEQLIDTLNDLFNLDKQPQT